MTETMASIPIGLHETWEVRKPAVRAAGGVVSTQHRVASEIGAQVLADGGNAVDAAVAAGFALGTVEPWMCGLGGCGQMIVHRADGGGAWSVDFGLLASRALNPADYPLDEGRGSDLFSWPAVVGDRNIMGPLSIAVPSYVDGMATALERFGTRSWAESLAPAIELAARGFEVDWYTTLKIASGAARLKDDPECRRIYLPGDLPPCAEWGELPPRIRLGRLEDTLRRLAEVGPRDFYEGEIARLLVADAASLGAKLEMEDLAAVSTQVREPLAVSYRDATVFAAPGLTAGASLARALELFAQHRMGVGNPNAPDATPGNDVDGALIYANSLTTTYAERLEQMGHDAEAMSPACTTHLSVVDRDGNLVALTQTLLSLFGSRVMFPSTGLLMNNGVMWFDPRPGRPNSLAAGKRPLSNMCPAVVACGNGDRFALGASGGRRILPSVAQLISFLVDYRMDLEAAAHAPRIDASGRASVAVDTRFSPEVVRALSEQMPVELWANGVFPTAYACPNTAGALSDGERIGAAFVLSPWAYSAPAIEVEAADAGAAASSRSA